MIKAQLQHRVGDFRLEIAFESDRPACGLWGPSGCGKTTTLNIIAGLLKPDSGRIEIDGEVWVDRKAGIWIPPQKRRVGYVFQEPRLFPHLDVRSNLFYGQNLRGTQPGGPPPEELFELLEINSFLDRRPENLSGGEARRVALGRALLSGPRLLLLDEPMAGLDSTLRGKLLPYIKEIHQRYRIPFILVSHMASDMLSLVEHLVAFGRGAVLGAGDPFEILFRAEQAWDEDEIAPINYWSVPIATAAEEGTQQVMVGDQRLVIPDCGLPVGATARFSIGANEIVLSTMNEIPAGFSTRNRLRIRIGEIRPFHGSAVAVVRDRMPQPLFIQLTQKSVRDLGLGAGSECWALIKTQSIRIE